MTEIIRRAEESCIETQNSIANRHQHVNALREKHNKRGAETSHSQDGRSQTHHLIDDEPGLSHQQDSHPAREGREQDGQMPHPSNEHDDSSQRLSPQHSQRNPDEQTPVDIVAKSQ